MADNGEPGQGGFGPRADRVGSRRRRPGRAVLNRGIAALAIAAAGDLIGFLFSLGSGGGTHAGGMVFFPIGGIFSLFLALVTIYYGRRVIRFAGSLLEEKKNKLEAFIDVEAEKRLARAGVGLAAISIAINPLILFALLQILGR